MGHFPRQLAQALQKDKEGRLEDKLKETKEMEPNVMHEP